jgi:predicted ATPase
LQWISGSVGKFEVAREHTAAFDKVFVPERHNHVAVLNDMKAWVDGWNAHHLWIMGWPEQARQAMQAGIDYARATGNPLNLIFCLVHGGGVSVYLREGDALLERAKEASLLAKENSLDFLEVMLVGIWRGSALMINRRFREGLEMMSAATALAVAANNSIMIPFHRLMAAEALAGLGRAEDAITMLDGELSTIEKTGERMYEAEILRLRGVLAAEQAGPDTSKASHAEEFLRRAIDLSKSQKAKGWELRTSTSLARLWQQQGKVKEAHDLLAPVYDWFTEGFDTKDLKAAKALLEELAA